VKAFVLIVALAGCATPPQERWLTAEEDAEMRAKCEPVGGCAMVPMPLWNQIEKLLRSLAGTSI